MLAENARYTESFDRSELRAAPLRHLAILASMDTRGDAGQGLVFDVSTGRLRELT